MDTETGIKMPLVNQQAVQAHQVHQVCTYMVPDTNKETDSPGKGDNLPRLLSVGGMLARAVWKLADSLDKIHIGSLGSPFGRSYGHTFALEVTAEK
jgi:hypothetical protein